MPSRVSGPACITCREKCRKCDRTQPSCQRCISKGLECKGYPEKYRFVRLTTWGKWKGRAFPTVGHNIPQTQTADNPPSVSQVLNTHTRSSATLVDPDVEFFFSSADHPLSHRGRTVELDDLLMLERTELLLSHCGLDIIRSLADPQKLCFPPSLRETIAKLSDLKFEQVNGCPRELFLIIGTVMEHAKAHEAGHMDTLQYERFLNAARDELHAWRLSPGIYPSDHSRWPAVAEAFRHACILHTSRLLDVYQPAEATMIQISVTAILDAIAEIPPGCHLIELLVMPLFMAGTDALSSYARHYVLLRFDHIKARAGFGHPAPLSLLQSVWDARGSQIKDDNRNVPWMSFTRTESEHQHDYLII
ncbi:hypothetical protein N7508_001651 [Penicillium antarcticum]|uniref:uncharacterized protein n=1 Tax=Penicillium antarcticum TaxID=416450 RepID=UPI00239F6CDF|nr:uncharacterized protein N7508_001651 [Penicillium antarcticum]KAJ5317143.1 hypothetical protein N7508_001651 [Penicillium antarcticum]